MNDSVTGHIPWSNVAASCTPHKPVSKTLIPAVLLGLVIMLLLSPQALGQALPPCLTVSGEATISGTVLQTQPSQEILLARLVYAEARSTGFADDERVYQAIAWGVMNRVRLSATSSQLRHRYGDGLAGVIFRKGQFNPAVSPRSPFSQDFLCPQNIVRWEWAMTAALSALHGEDNPFLKTPWELRHGLSLVVNFYYPRSVQARGPLPPWEDDPGLRFIGPVSITGTVLPAQRIRFYRLTTPPADIKVSPARNQDRE